MHSGRGYVAGTVASEPPDEALVFAPCSFSWTNKGDAALAQAMEASLSDELGQVRLVLTSFTPDEDAERYGFDVLRMPLPPDGRIAGRLHRFSRTPGLGRLIPPVVLVQLVLYLCLMRLWRSLRRAAPGLALRVLPSAQRDLVEVIGSATVVAAAPGGYLMAQTVMHYFWLYHVATLGLCSVLGRPILLMPGSYGPFPGLHRYAARWLFTRCELVMARDQISADEASAAGLPSGRIRLVADTAFLLPDGAGAAELADHGIDRMLPAQGLLGVSVMSHDFPGSKDPAAALDAYLHGVAAALDSCCRNGDITPVFVSQVSGDEESSRAVITRMKEGGRAVCLDDDLTPFGLKALYARFELLLGSRIHANILAMSSGVPTVAIAYEHKARGIMDLAGLGEYVVSITEPDHLEAVLAKAWESRSSNRSALARRLPGLKASAAEAAATVAAACREPSASP